jgi:hypothetical protein
MTRKKAIPDGYYDPAYAQTAQAVYEAGKTAYGVGKGAYQKTQEVLRRIPWYQKHERWVKIGFMFGVWGVGVWLIDAMLKSPLGKAIGMAWGETWGLFSTWAGTTPTFQSAQLWGSVPVVGPIFQIVYLTMNYQGLTNLAPTDTDKAKALKDQLVAFFEGEGIYLVIWSMICAVIMLYIWMQETPYERELRLARSQI